MDFYQSADQDYNIQDTPWQNQSACSELTLSTAPILDEATEHKIFNKNISSLCKVM